MPLGVAGLAHPKQTGHPNFTQGLDLQIPDEAMTAATEAVKKLPGGADSQWAAEVALNASASIIAAQALRDEAPRMHNKHDSVWLNRRADDLDPR